MSVLKQSLVVALTIAAVSFCAAPAATAANPLEKFFANAGRKVVGGAYQSVEKNIRQSSRLVLKAAPYALLQGSSSRGSRSNGSSGSFQSSSVNPAATFGNGVTGGTIQGRILKTMKSGSVPTPRPGNTQRPIFFSPRFGR